MKTKLVVTVAIFLMLIVCIIPVYAENEYEAVEAKVVEVGETQEIEQENGITKKEQKIEVRILEGEYENEEYEMNYVISEDINDVTSNVELKEDDTILVSIEEKEGEVTKVNYKENITQNYMLYIILAVLIIAVLVIGKTKVIKPIIVYLAAIIFICYIFVFAIQNGWNLILISSIISAVITVIVAIKVNGVDKKAGAMIICSIVGCTIAGILMYLLFDIMNFNNINIKMADGFVNVKELFCSVSILFGGILSNIIILSSFNMFMFLNKPYKTKSDNIIEGQRSLKL